jgi:hypothetical protein
MSDKFTLIGEKLEVIVNLNAMIENMTYCYKISTYFLFFKFF